MKEDGIDISGHTSNHVDEYKDIPFDFVITVCDNVQEICPVLSNKAVKLHHDFRDPAKASDTDEEIMVQFRIAREEIKSYCRNFVEQYL